MKIDTERHGVAAIVVTHNRLSLLRECIESLRSQTKKLEAIIVVNNDSSDGTKEWLDGQDDLVVIHQRNLGSAGGQFSGIKEGYSRGCNWFWCMDDDTIPESDTNAEVHNSGLINKQKVPGFISTRVFWTNGQPSKFIPDYGNLSEPEGDGIAPVWAATFVGVYFSREAVRSCGLPIPELFIWGDDYEYTTRIAKKFECYQVRSARVVHKTPEDKPFIDYWYDKNPKMKIKHRYSMRNSVFIARQEERRVLLKIVVVFRKILGAIYHGFITGKRDPILIIDAIKGGFFNPKIRFVEQN